MDGAMRNHVTDRIEDYLTGEIAPRALQVFHRHVGQCPSCAKAVRDAQQSQSYLQWLRPVEAPPAPGPDFYFKVQRSIQQKSAPGWIGSLAAMFHRPRFAYPLLFLFLGLLLTAWSTSFQTEWSEAGILGIPPARFSGIISTEADRIYSRDLVMVSLVGED